MMGGKGRERGDDGRRGGNVMSAITHFGYVHIFVSRLFQHLFIFVQIFCHFLFHILQKEQDAFNWSSIPN